METQLIITEFLTNGFYIAGASGINDNGSGTNGVVAWCWKGGTPEISSGGSVGFDGANGTNLHINIQIFKLVLHQIGLSNFG